MMRTGRFGLALFGLLAAYLLVAYGHAFQLAFVNDDYLFLEKVRERSFWELWLPEELLFDWYRPWSREVHYWVLNRLAGLHEPSYHAAHFLLALAVLLLYFRLAYRLMGRGPAGLATAAVTALGVWSTPMLWIAGAQDLWMLLFGLLFLLAVLSGRTVAAVVPLALALLSKETAGVLPAIASAGLWILEGRPIRSALARTAGFWAVAAVWVIAHPTLRGRISGAVPSSIEAEHRPAPAITVLKTILAQANMENAFAPEVGWGPVLLRGFIGGVLLCAVVLVAYRTSLGDSPPDKPRHDSARVTAFGCAWAAIGFAILLLPSIGWHAYYGVLGSLGLWLAIACAMARRRALALALVMVLALTREARAATPSWDWGTDWYLTRAGSVLNEIRIRLLRFHPSLPPRSRLYFARLPNNIGLLAGNGPAIRIWYDDPTLEGRYYSAYAPRAAHDPAPDYFFRFDTTQVLVEIHTGPELLPAAVRANPGWQRDHDILAALFLRTGNLSDAAAEYRKLAQALPNRSDYLLYAGAAHEATGAHSAADSFYRIAARTLGDSVVRRRAADLVQAIPRRVR